jgi:hypothetical protein
MNIAVFEHTKASIIFFFKKKFASYSDLFSEFICWASTSSPRAANKDRPVEV